jgi:Predicted pyridoxal phosphate-dependent enzyme apparently involved in regulation of cell wall biogenesis
MESFKHSSGLGMNGAPPAFDKPLHAGRPNIGDRKAFLQGFNEIFDNAWLTNNGTMVRKVERRIATHSGVKCSVAMCNGTIALEKAHSGSR